MTAVDARRASTSDPPAGPGWSWRDAAAMLALVALVPVVHDGSTYFRPAYWLDESWVAVSVKAPLADLPDVNGPTPLGWTLLLRAVPATDGLRVMSLLGLVAAVVLAYCLGRAAGGSGRWPGVMAGVAAGASVLLLPVTQLLHDLKPYASDAAMAIGLLALASWAERTRSPRRLAVLGGAAVGGLLVSHVAAIVAAAVMSGLVLEPLARRHWRAAAESLAAGAATAAGLAAVYLVVTARTRTNSLDAYWAAYLPAADADLPAYLGLRMSELRPQLGLPWPVFLGLVVIGVVVVARRRPATATGTALVPVVLLGLGLTGNYPLLDPRTSAFVFVLGAAFMGIGVAGAGTALGRGRVWVTAVVIAVALSGFAAANREWWRVDTRNGEGAVIAEDVRAQVRHVQANRRPEDVILVSEMGVFGFGYYWDADEPSFVATSEFATRFTLGYPDRSNIVIARGRDESSIVAALSRAERGAAGSGGRIWVVRTHVSVEEQAAWTRALAGQPVTTLYVGVEPLLVLTEPG